MWFGLLWMLSCARSYLKVHPDYQLEEMHPVLLGSATLRADSFFPANPEQSSMEQMLEFQLQTFVNSRLPSVGEGMVDSVLPKLSEWGMVPFVQPERADKLVRWGGNQDEKYGALVFGVWYSPDGAQIPISNSDWLTYRRIERYRERVQEGGGETEGEGLIFVHASYHASNFLLSRYPILILDVVLLGEEGQVWLRARGIGEGNRNMLFLDLGEESLQLALDNAIASLDLLEVEELRPKRIPKK